MEETIVYASSEAKAHALESSASLDEPAPASLISLPKLTPQLPAVRAASADAPMPAPERTRSPRAADVEVPLPVVPAASVVSPSPVTPPPSPVLVVVPAVLHKTNLSEIVMKKVKVAIDSGNFSAVANTVENNDDLYGLTQGFLFPEQDRKKFLIKSADRIFDADVVSMKGLLSAALNPESKGRVVQLLVLSVTSPNGYHFTQFRPLVEELTKIVDDVKLLKEVIAANPQSYARRMLKCANCTPVHSFVCAYCWPSKVCKTYFWCPGSTTRASSSVTTTQQTSSEKKVVKEEHSVSENSSKNQETTTATKKAAVSKAEDEETRAKQTDHEEEEKEKESKTLSENKSEKNLGGEEKEEADVSSKKVESHEDKKSISTGKTTTTTDEDKRDVNTSASDGPSDGDATSKGNERKHEKEEKTEQQVQKEEEEEEESNKHYRAEKSNNKTFK